MAFTVENMNYNDSAEVIKGPEAKVGPQAEKELNEALQAIQAHEDAKKTVESTGKLAEKEMKEAGIPSDPKERGDLEISDTPEPLSKMALMNRLEGNIFNVMSQDQKMKEELKYAFTPDERVKNLNRNPESSKQIQMETGTVAYT